MDWKIVINDKFFPNKSWDCIIETRRITSPSTILHEMLHSKSISYYTSKDFTSNPGFKEILDHLFTQEISKKEEFELIKSSYDDKCDNFKLLNGKHKIASNNYLFAKELLTQEKNGY